MELWKEWNRKNGTQRNSSIPEHWDEIFRKETKLYRALWNRNAIYLNQLMLEGWNLKWKQNNEIKSKPKLKYGYVLLFEFNNRKF